MTSEVDVSDLVHRYLHEGGFQEWKLAEAAEALGISGLDLIGELRRRFFRGAEEEMSTLRALENDARTGCDCGTCAHCVLRRQRLTLTRQKVATIHASGRVA
jgi:hypothetical protein